MGYFLPLQANTKPITSMHSFFIELMKHEPSIIVVTPNKKVQFLVGHSAQNSTELCSSAQILQIFVQNFIFSIIFSLAEPSVCPAKCSGHVLPMFVLMQILTY